MKASFCIQAQPWAACLFIFLPFPCQLYKTESNLHVIQVETEAWVLAMTHPGLHGQPMEESEAVTGLYRSQIRGYPL